MKHNLKNRPKINVLTLRKDVEDWFEGFEKELRETLGRYYEFFSVNDISPCMDTIIIGECKLIKEILGE